MMTTTPPPLWYYTHIRLGQTRYISCESVASLNLFSIFFYMNSISFKIDNKANHQIMSYSTLCMLNVDVKGIEKQVDVSRFDL